MPSDNMAELPLTAAAVNLLIAMATLAPIATKMDFFDGAAAISVWSAHEEKLLQRAMEPSYGARLCFCRCSAFLMLAFSSDTSSATWVGDFGTGLASISRPARFLSMSSRKL